MRAGEDAEGGLCGGDVDAFAGEEEAWESARWEHISSGKRGSDGNRRDAAGEVVYSGLGRHLLEIEVGGAEGLSDTSGNRNPTR